MKNSQDKRAERIYKFIYPQSYRYSDLKLEVILLLSALEALFCKLYAKLKGSWKTPYKGGELVPTFMAYDKRYEPSVVLFEEEIKRIYLHNFNWPISHQGKI